LSVLEALWPAVAALWLVVAAVERWGRGYEVGETATERTHWLVHWQAT
jgi:hypothetical protein